MAVWQCDFVLVPQDKLSVVMNGVSNKIERVIFENTEWWENHQPPLDYCDRLDAMLPRGNWWCANTSVWGIEDSDFIKVHTSASMVDEILVRLDVRNTDKRAVKQIHDFAQYCDCVFLAGDMSWVSSYEALTDKINESSAKKFVENPQEFLKMLPLKM